MNKDNQRDLILKEFCELRDSLIPNIPKQQEYRQLIGDKKYKKYIKDYILKCPKKEFYLTIQLSHPQSYGSFLQERIKNGFKLSKPIDRNSGDASGMISSRKIELTNTPFTNNREIKITLITKSNLIANLHQFRLYHNCDYLILVADVRDTDNPIEYFFELTHDELLKELSFCKGYNSHNNKESNEYNKHVEKSIDLPFDTEEPNSNFNRWCKIYRIPSPWDN